MKKDYVMHKFQIYNDKLHWPTILASTRTHGEIYHMDYSENLTQLFKYEPQSSHFNKSQYSLHCTVKHTGNNESPYQYLYHLSNEMKHDHAFTSAVVNNILESNGAPPIIRLKSDNCSTQYKCKSIFRYWNNLAKSKHTKVILYYGASGHGKGLVDAMSASGVKSPLTRAVITHNLQYSNAEDVHQYLIDLFQNDANKTYIVLPSDKISQSRNDSPLVIKGCRNLHMLSFFPDGSIQSKVNICSCNSCIEGEFISYLTEKGKSVQLVTEASDDDDSAESEFENDFDEEETDTEAYEL